MRRLLLLALVAVAACGDGGGGGSAACGPVRREALDPSSAAHVLPGAPEPEYLTDPPTSGPHEPVAPATGVLDEPLSRPVQVGNLEGGVVFFQYRDLDPDEQAALEALAVDGAVVAPNPDLPDRVVATAWLFKQTCDAVDVDALTTFASEHGGEGPGSDG